MGPTFPKWLENDKDYSFDPSNILDTTYLKSRFPFEKGNISTKSGKYTSRSGIENIIFTGFSLGGSVCQIAAWDFLKTNSSLISKLHCYSFGASNPGNKEFARQFNEIPFVERVVYNRDPVPILPPRMFGYSRTKNPVLIKKENGEYKFLSENRTLPQNAKILSRTVYSKLFNKENKDWEDHSLKKIKNAFKSLN